MAKHDEPFQPEKLEEQIDQLLAQAASDSIGSVEPERRLVQDLHHVHADDTPSGERVWARLAEKLAEQNATPHHLHVISNPRESRKRVTSMSTPELNTLQSQQAGASQKPRRFFELVAAVLLTVLLVGGAAWVFTASHLSHNQPTLGSATLKGISAGKLLCSASVGPNTVFGMGQPRLDWSARGIIATTNPLKAFSAHTCAAQSLTNVPATSFEQPVWSPDGKRLLLFAGNTANVVDASTGSVLTTFHTDYPGEFGQAVWTSNAAHIVSMNVNVLSHTSQSVKVQVWDASTGTLIRTAFTAADGILIGSAWISPNGTVLALQRSNHQIEFWDIATGKRVSTTATSVSGNGQATAWSPDGSFLAIGISSANWPTVPGSVQIWSTSTGHLMATLQDKNTFEGAIDGLAWSPNGTYLAESSAEIHIWNVMTGQLVTTFGKVATKTTASNGSSLFSQIASVTWAPDSATLASLTSTSTSSGSGQKTLHVWLLS